MSCVLENKEKMFVIEPQLIQKRLLQYYFIHNMRFI